MQILKRLLNRVHLTHLFLPFVYFILTPTSGFCQPAPDRDQDGIDDNLERRLLMQFRPYFKFSRDGDAEHYNPTDAIWYIRTAELLKSGNEDDDHPIVPNSVLSQNPSALLFLQGMYGPSNITQAAGATNYHINPMEHVNIAGGSNPGRHGADWSVILANKNTGLYGHVVPIKLLDPSQFQQSNVGANPQGRIFYKIEYWQFFGYNNAAKPQDIGDHEGDWCSVQLLYDLQNNKIISVFHFAHGVQMRFDLGSARSIVLVENGNIKEFRGPRYNTGATLGSLGSHFNIDVTESERQSVNNNILQLLKAPGETDYVHPVVYIEYGGHEFWPTSSWGFYGAPKHNGDDMGHIYLTNTPPNLGEVEHPMNETGLANVILQYNGYWGAYSRLNDPPHGPALHLEWTWPASSSIGWQLHGLGF